MDGGERRTSSAITFALSDAAFDVIAQQGAPNAECSEALAQAITDTGQRAVRCSSAAAYDLREWFTVAARLMAAVGDTARASACTAAVEQIDGALRAIRRRT